MGGSEHGTTNTESNGNPKAFCKSESQRPQRQLSFGDPFQGSGVVRPCRRFMVFESGPLKAVHLSRHEWPG